MFQISSFGVFPGKQSKYKVFFALPITVFIFINFWYVCMCMCVRVCFCVGAFVYMYVYACTVWLCVYACVWTHMHVGSRASHSLTLSSGIAAHLVP